MMEAMSETVTPWTEREFVAALRAAGWKREKGPARIYRSPEYVTFHLDEYGAGLGILWRHYAARRELPEGRPGWQMRLREKMKGVIEGE